MFLLAGRGFPNVLQLDGFFEAIVFAAIVAFFDAKFIRKKAMTEPDGIPQPSQKQIVHAIRFTIRGDVDTSFIVWPRDSGNLCARLINSRRTWLHTSTGDGVVLTRDGNTERQESINQQPFTPPADRRYPCRQQLLAACAPGHVVD